MSLDRLANAVFAQLELASGASAKAMGEYTTHGKGQGNQPPRVSTPHLHFGSRYEHSNTDTERRAVILDALEELRAIRYAQRKPALTTKEIRLMIGGDPRPREIVMYVWNISRRHYYRCRAEHDQAVRAGVPSVRAR
jgi:hypothetical protein